MNQELLNATLGNEVESFLIHDNMPVSHVLSYEFRDPGHATPQPATPFKINLMLAYN